MGVVTDWSGVYAEQLTLIDPASPAGVQPVGQSGKTLVFSDEFQASALDTGKWIPWYPDTAFWNTTTPGGHKTNSYEPQGYDDTGISFVTEGSDTFMRLTLRESNHAVPELAYTSGMVCSYPSFNTTYGYFEARMRLPNISGAWPAFWMDPTDQTWPPEIDIMELWGANPNVIRNAYYSETTGWTTSNATFSDAGAWHTYAVWWEPTGLTWYRDGVQTKRWTGNVPTKDMYLICNLAGDFNNVAGVAANAPFYADVDYIRAWG